MRQARTRRQAWKEGVARLWGLCNDAAYYDGWRTYGDSWAMDYVLSCLQSGVDLMRGPTPRAQLITLLTTTGQDRTS